MISSKDFKNRQIVFVFLNKGESIIFRNDNIVIKDSDKKTKFQTTCYLLFALFLVGSTSITTGIIDRMKRFRFSIILMTYTFRVFAILNSPTEGNVILRKKQYVEKDFSLGAYIISNKITNQYQVLKEIRNKSNELKIIIDKLKSYATAVREKGLGCQQIMGIEGSASRFYFKEMFGNSWTARRPRVKHDLTNCLLDIGYTMLFNIVNALIEMYGFDSYVGVLHREFFQRKSLTCDLIEPFRPVIDKAIRKATNLGKVKETDFFFSQNQYFLYGKSAVPYIRFLSEEILEHKDSIYLYIQQYYRAFIRDKEIDEYPWFNMKEK